VRSNQALVTHSRNLAFRMSTAIRTPRNIISYNGILAVVSKLVFQAACRTRFANSTVKDLIRLTRNLLDSSIVSATLEGARRLLPPDNSPEGQDLRKVEMVNKALQTLVVETNVIAQLQKFQPLSMLTEQQQKESNRVNTEAGLVNVVKAPPNLLFSKATSLCGFCTNWDEHKNTFGLKSNLCVHGRIKKQPKRYTETFGDGKVVFKLGYELEHLSTEVGTS
jgi:hypothetical protein